MLPSTIHSLFASTFFSQSVCQIFPKQPVWQPLSRMLATLPKAYLNRGSPSCWAEPSPAADSPSLRLGCKLHTEVPTHVQLNLSPFLSSALVFSNGPQQARKVTIFYMRLSGWGGHYRDRRSVGRFWGVFSFALVGVSDKAESLLLTDVVFLLHLCWLNC